MNLMNQIEYLHDIKDVDMFDDCTVPNPLDMERVRAAIVMRCGLLTPIFSEPLLQRIATQEFFAENQWNFAHIVNIINAEYSPIENVSEAREETYNTQGSDAVTITKTGTESHSGTDVRNIVEGGTTAEERTISAENVSTYAPDSKETTAHGKTTQDNITHGHTIANSGTDTHASNKNENSTHAVNRHGNIGVTTNQKMINEEIDLLERFNPYRFISNLYEKELILGLY